jgi:hypothetical protein
MNQQQQRLKKRDESYNSRFYSHLSLDSAGRENGISLLRDEESKRALPAGSSKMVRDNFGLRRNSATIAGLHLVL